jgi:cytochrome c553
VRHPPHQSGKPPLPGAIPPTPAMKLPRVLLVLVPALLALTAYAAGTSAYWAETCAKCHGEDGKGQTKMGKKLGIKDYTDPAVQAHFTDEEAFLAMKNGLKDEKGKVLMKPVEGISDDEIKALVAFVRSLKP